MSVKERLKKYIDYKGIKNIEFTESIGASQGYINAIRKSIPADKLAIIKNKYPDLNIMSNTSNNQENQLNTSSDQANLDMIHHDNDIDSIGNKPMGEFISELSMMAMQRRGDGLDLSKFSKDQVDKLLDTAAKNEDNSYNYHLKKTRCISKNRNKEN